MRQYSPSEQLTLANILLVDADEGEAESLAQSLIDEPYQVLVVDSPAEAVLVLARETVDVVLARLGSGNGPDGELFSTVRKRNPSIIRIGLASESGVVAAARAVRAGRVHRYLRTPCTEGELALALYNTLVQRSFLPPESEGVLPIPAPSLAPVSSRSPPAG
jgi:DNA-binding NtrC family response regulator